MRIGILTQWYEPEPGPAALPAVMARALAARGHEVHVITAFPNYPSGKVIGEYRQRLRLREDLGGVRVTRVPVYLSHDRSAARRIANYASFGLSAAVLGMPTLPNIDVLWVNYSPITVALPMWLQQLTRRTPTVCEVGDLWPDTMAVSGLQGAGLVSSLGERLMARWCNAMYASSDAVVYISPGVGPLLNSRGVPREKLSYIPKPANEEIFHAAGASMRSELNIDPEAVVLVYAGAMGAAQNLEALVEACANVDDPRLVVLLAGSGTHEASLRESVARRGASSVRFLGRLPESRMADLLCTGDAAFVGLAEHPLSAVTMPSKTQAILASGRPILVAGFGDVAHLVRSNSVGFSAAPGDAVSIAEGLRSLLRAGRPGLAAMGAAARALYAEHFSVEGTMDQIEKLLVDVSGSYVRGTVSEAALSLTWCEHD